MEKNNSEHPMIEIKGGRNITIEDSATTGEKLLFAENVDDIRVKRSSAGLNSSERLNNNKWWSIFGKPLLGLLSSLIVAYLVYIFGWN